MDNHVNNATTQAIKKIENRVHKQRLYTRQKIQRYNYKLDETRSEGKRYNVNLKNTIRVANSCNYSLPYRYIFLYFFFFTWHVLLLFTSYKLLVNIYVGFLIGRSIDEFKLTECSPKGTTENPG